MLFQNSFLEVSMESALLKVDGSLLRDDKIDFLLPRRQKKEHSRMRISHLLTRMDGLSV